MDFPGLISKLVPHPDRAVVVAHSVRQWAVLGAVAGSIVGPVLAARNAFDIPRRVLMLVRTGQCVAMGVGAGAAGAALEYNVNYPSRDAAKARADVLRARAKNMTHLKAECSMLALKWFDAGGLSIAPIVGIVAGARMHRQHPAALKRLGLSSRLGAAMIGAVAAAGVGGTAVMLIGSAYCVTGEQTEDKENGK